MDKESNIYIILYASAITVVVAIVLALMSEALKEPQYQNELNFQKEQILQSIGVTSDSTDNPIAFFDENLTGLVINPNGEVVEGVEPLSVDLKSENKKTDADSSKLLPLYIYQKGEKTIYIMPLWGAGLWDYINGYLAVEPDFNTVYGAAFDHKGETPGLGAEIKDKYDFRASFHGKTLFDDNQFVGVEVKKGVLGDPEHQVAAISGATITSNGVTQMIYDDVQDYLPYFEKLKTEKQ